MNVVIGIIVGLLVLTFLIVSHEFGHFIMARRSGVWVKEFGIGFPPRLVAWTRNRKTKKLKKLKKESWKEDQKDLIISINAIPLGGFCQMDGESDDETRQGTFGSVSFWKKTKILFGGVVMNWLTAFLILTVLCWTGLPAVTANQFSIKSDETITSTDPITVDEVATGSPAEIAGFQVGDQILAVEAKKYTTEECARMGVNKDGSSPCEETEKKVTVRTSSDIIEFNNAHAGKTITYTVSRKYCNHSECETEPAEGSCNNSNICTGEYKNYKLTATLNPANSEYLLGITMSQGSFRTKYTWSAPIVAAGLTVQLTVDTYKGLGNMLWNLITGAARQISLDSSVRESGRTQMSEATEGVSGIVGMIGSYFPWFVELGPTYVALLAAIISISLACMNVLPIPALDGGRWLMIAISRLRHKRLSKEAEQKYVARSFIFLLILMALITIMDIIRLF
ncbi:site-2 protease family protein [Candidatus Saccharibacteria bacterium]|nr:site-2 protease family protein [Candidatus Saccharibacteria bacterium]